MDADPKSPLQEGRSSAFHAASCSPAPFYEVDGITLYHGDMREILPHLSPVDAVVTDPPYNETSLEWDVWPEGWPSMLAPLTSSLWCFGSMRMFWDRVGEFGEWKLAQDVVWEKHNGSGIASDRFRRVHELALHLYRGEWNAIYKAVPRVGEHRAAKMMRRGKTPHLGVYGAVGIQEGQKLMRSVIYANSCQGYAVNETQKPEAIIAPLMEYAVPPGGSVLDCFAGSGTVLAVARSQGKRAVGIERRESQCREIVKRLSQRELSLGNADYPDHPSA
jgi:site-specific DNA-methyltransferase (adenine-specific)